MVADLQITRRGAYIFTLIYSLFVAVILAVACLHYRDYKAHFRENVEQQLSAIADLKANELIQWRRERLGDAELIHENNAFTALARNLLSKPQEADVRDELQEWLREYLIPYKYDEVRLLDSHGATFFSVPDDHPSVSSAVMGQIPEVLHSKEIAIVDFYRDEHDGRVYLSVLVPVIDEQAGKRAIAVLALRVNPGEYLYPLLKRWPTPSQTAETLLVRREGNDVLFLNNAKFQKDSALKLRFPLNVNDGRALPSVKAVLGQTGIVEGMDYRGEPVIASVTGVSGSPWFLVARIDRSEVYASLWDHLKMMVALIGALLFGSAASIGLVWRHERAAFFRDRYESAEALRKSEAHYRAVSETAYDAFVTADNLGTITGWNSGAERVFGYTEREIIGQPLVVVVPPRYRALHLAGMERMNTGGEPRATGKHLELEGLRKDGSEFPLELSLAIWNISGKRFYTAIVRDITERKRAEQALRESEESLRESQSIAGLGSYRLNILTGLWDSSTVLDELFGIDESFERTVEGWESLIHPDDRNRLSEHFKNEVLAEGAIFNMEYRILRRNDKTERWVHGLGKVEHDGQGRPVTMHGTIQDVTDRKQAEEEKEKLVAQLQQAQKMEAVGQLAGGVAHDFNNMLQVILGSADMMRDDLGVDTPSRRRLEELRRAACRAADLTRQLLAFSRRQIIQPANVDMNDLVQGVLKMIGRVIGEHIQLSFLPGEDVGAVRVDRGQIEQVLMNLCVNARDAMPNGGTLTIETQNVEVGEEYCSEHPWTEEGSYLLLTVTDTGHGMDAATRAHIFEPFFTTKEVGKGTGLGLASVYGIVKQHLGFVHVYSEPGMGTAFKVYLPLVDQPVDTVRPNSESSVVGGTETILVAEDEEMVQDTVVRVLRRAGYTVLTACDGDEALHVFENNADAINLVLLDVMMPRLSGRDVMDRIQAKHPGTRFLFSSGYSENGIHTDFIIKEGVRLIAKPYHRTELLRVVRETLDASVELGAFPS